MAIVVDTANRSLQEYFYRHNFAVFVKDTISMMSENDTASWEKLMLEYAERWPLASKIPYQVELNDSLGPTDEAPEAIVIPCSLIYSMPDTWQVNLLIACRIMEAIKEDNNEYFVHAGESYFNDPFRNRHRRWDSDRVLLDRGFDPGSR
jgi:hypothetical protein